MARASAAKPVSFRQGVRPRPCRANEIPYAFVAIVRTLFIFLWVLSHVSMPSAQTAQFQIEQLAPKTFVETRLDGERVVHRGYEATVRPPPNLPWDVLSAAADRLFDEHVRQVAETERAAYVFITFVLGAASHGSAVHQETFRVVYMQEGEKWKKNDGMPKNR
jgi:hypothetical protein